MSLPNPQKETSAVPADAIQISRMLLALDKAGYLLSPGVKARAIQIVQLAATHALEEQIETELLNRQLAERSTRCPELDSLLSRLTLSKAG